MGRTLYLDSCETLKSTALKHLSLVPYPFANFLYILIDQIISAVDTGCLCLWKTNEITIKPIFFLKFHLAKHKYPSKRDSQKDWIHISTQKIFKRIVGPISALELYWCHDKYLSVTLHKRPFEAATICINNHYSWNHFMVYHSLMESIV